MVMRTRENERERKRESKVEEEGKGVEGIYKWNFAYSRNESYGERDIYTFGKRGFRFPLHPSLVYYIIKALHTLFL